MTTAPPNIILILTDHFRRDALGSSTPNLMALANAGVRFSHAYSPAPLCQPARTCLVTGMHPSHTGVCGNQSDPIAPSLRDDTFMHHLREAGYHTALVGKHHFLDRHGLRMDIRDDKDEIRRYGFDKVFQVLDDGENGHNGDEYTHWLDEQGRLEEFRNALSGSGRGFQHPYPEDETADGFIGVHGIKFVEEYDKSKPFYLNLSFIGPHPPLWHPGQLGHDPDQMSAPLGAPDEPSVRLRRAHYMDKCALIDRYVGRLVDALEEKGLRDNTVIIFTSDHGDCLGDFGIFDKRHFYESSVGVPLFMQGPGIPEGERLNGPRVSQYLCTHLDLYPTILGIAGAETAPDKRRPGRDLVRMVRDDEAPHPAVFSELATCVMIRTGNWKLVFDPEQGGVQQLYNHTNDPHELNNLAGVAGYENVTLDLTNRILAHKIRQTQFTHVKEEQRLQRVRAGY